MPRDIERAKATRRRYAAELHAKKYGPNAGDQRGRYVRIKRKRIFHPRMVSSHGYVKIRVGISHPLSDANGYAFEHFLVWLSAGRQRPHRTYVIRHKDDDKTNNRLENLECITKTEARRMQNARSVRNPETCELFIKLDHGENLGMER